MTGSRKNLRLERYDYAASGAYFVTVCAQGRAGLFGEVVDDEMRVNNAGELIRNVWNELPSRFQNVVLDEFVVMPNHVHGIVWMGVQKIADVGALLAAPGHDVPATPNQGAASSAPTLGGVMRAFKSLSAIAVNRLLERTGVSVWQRNYYEHVIRDERELNLVREYIVNNPLQWSLDRENPQAKEPTAHPELTAIFGKNLP